MENDKNSFQKFGQIVIGHPGSGKTTYIKAIKDLYINRKINAVTINLDPANENAKNNFDIDISELIDLKDVQTKLKLGPNGSFLYCINFLEKNITWLRDKIDSFKDSYYYIIDTPGQIEIFTSSKEFKNICDYIINKINIKLCCVNLIDCINLFDISNYFFSVFNVLNSMIFLALPQTNFISKCDLIQSFKHMQNNKNIFPLSFYKNPNDEEYLKLYFKGLNLNQKYNKLNEKVTNFICDYSLVFFNLLDLSNPRHLNRAAYLIDKANGFIYQEELKDKIESFVTLAKNDILDETDAIDEDYDF